jgi:hypothetical protein
MNRKVSLAAKAVKLGLVGATGIASMIFTGVAMAQNDGSASDGDLFLVLVDNTASTSYVEDLGVTTATVASDTTVDTAAHAATGGQLSTALPGISPTFAADTSLSTYLSAHSSDSYSWMVVANSEPVAYASPAPTTANNILLSTAQKPISASYNGNTGGGMTNSQVNGNAQSLAADIDNWLTVMAPNGVNANSYATSGFQSLTANNFLPGGSVDKAVLNWYGSGSLTPSRAWTPSSGSDASNFYLLTDSSSANLLSAIYNLGTATLSANGTLTFAPLNAVPLPAAVWLFGSALLGLAGVSRRRNIAA